MSSGSHCMAAVILLRISLSVKGESHREVGHFVWRYAHSLVRPRGLLVCNGLNPISLVVQRDTRLRRSARYRSTYRKNTNIVF